jgi:acyl-CoA synthetase (NDP forming)
MHELEPLFRPRSIAVIGASADPTKLGGRVLHNLATLGYRGAIHPVHATATEVQGLPAHRGVLEIEQRPDQAIIILPAPAVEGALADCAAKGIRAVQILSSGFGEAGAEGLAMQARLVEIARQSGMRIAGPNALGSISPPDGFFATFSSLMSSARPQPGVIGVATQSGAFGSHVYAAAMLRGLGISRAIATGNEADVDVAACIDYLAEDPGTEVICAALEGCRDGTALRHALLKAAARRKPVVLMKVGSTELGAAAAATHTGALAGEDRIFDTVFRECGAWRARSIEEMVDIAYLCSVGRMPPAPSVGIVTISGGIGVLMADACIEAGLSVPPVPEEALERIRSALPVAGGRNPVDTTAGVGGRLPAFGPVTEAVLDVTGAGTILLYLSHIGRNPPRFAPMQTVLERLRKRYPDRLLITVMTVAEEVRRGLEAIGVPVFEDPTRAVAATAAAAGLRALQEAAEPLPEVPVAAPPALAGGHEAAAKAMLAGIGIPVLPERACTSAEQAVGAAEELGYPVVLKILSEDIPHKTDVGGVMLGLRDAGAVAAGFTAIMDRVRTAMPSARIAGVLVAPMVQGGVETIIGVQRDPVFGPMVMFGLGGVSVELFRDVAFASAPLTPRRAERLIASTRGARLLEGWRGAPPLDCTALVDALCRVSAAAVAHREALEGVEINPFLVREEGAVVLDALLSLRSAPMHTGAPDPGG